MTTTWAVDPVALLAQGTNGTKFYQAGVAFDDVTGNFFTVFNWSGGTPHWDWFVGQIQVAKQSGAAAPCQTLMNNKLASKRKGGYDDYEVFHPAMRRKALRGDRVPTVVADRIKSFAVAAARGATAGPAATVNVPLDDVAKAAAATENTAARLANLLAAWAPDSIVQAMELRGTLLTRRDELAALKDEVEDQIALLDLRLLSI